ncbi:MAG: hypothetical protein ACFCUG_10870 [Thiotrichales bacterium]
MKHTPPCPEIDTLIAATLFLLSRYHLERRSDLAQAIAQHFAMLLEHPDLLRSRTLRSACRSLSIDWQNASAQTPSSIVISPSRAPANVH